MYFRDTTLYKYLNLTDNKYNNDSKGSRKKYKI